jgi:pyruvate formate lyase activating enzyme
VRKSVPLIPRVNDNDEDIDKAIEFAKCLGVEDIGLMPFHRFGATRYQFLGLESPHSALEKISDERVNVIMKRIESKDVQTSVEGPRKTFAIYFL